MEAVKNINISQINEAIGASNDRGKENYTFNHRMIDDMQYRA